MSAFICSALLMETCKHEILFPLLHIKQRSFMINGTFSASVRIMEIVGMEGKVKKQNPDLIKEP